MKSFDGFMRHVQQAEQPTGTRSQWMFGDVFKLDWVHAHTPVLV